MTHLVGAIDPDTCAAQRYQSALAQLPEVLELAAEACRAPMAALKVFGVGEAHFAATLGIGATADVPRSSSLCSVVCAADHAIVIEDAADDPRFRSHPLVCGPAQVRFLAAAPLHHDGRAIGALCVFDDVPRSDRSATTQRLLTRIAQAVDAESSLRHLIATDRPFPTATGHDDVVASISHEIRTPLASIRGNLELLTGTAGAIAPGFERRVAAITRSADRLCRTMENLLCAADQQMHQPIGQQRRIDLGEVLAAAISATDDQSGRIHAQLPAGRVSITADAQLLQTAVSHLLHNALLFGGADQPVEVSLHADPQPTVTIRDHGPGLDHPTHQLGLPFRRGENARTQQIPGLGLGLAISHRIVEAQGGTLSLLSTPGAGVTARITFMP